MVIYSYGIKFLFKVIVDWCFASSLYFHFLDHACLFSFALPLWRLLLVVNRIVFITFSKQTILLKYFGAELLEFKYIGLDSKQATLNQQELT